MANPFLEHLDRWLPQILREKAIASVREERLAVIGANDFATMLADFVLGQLSVDPNCCWTACGTESLEDDAIVAAAHLDAEIVGVGLLGVVVELSRWQGEAAVKFLVAHDVPAEDARLFVGAVEVISEKLSERGRRMLERIDAARAAPKTETPSFAAAIG